MTYLPFCTGRLIRKPQVLSAGTSYSKPAGCNAILVECVGGGGGGGGAQASASQTSPGSGGASGAYVRKFFDVSSLAGPFTYAIGAGGVGGTGNTGGVAPTGGGNTSITVGGITITAVGGSAPPGNGPSAITVDFVLSGSSGQGTNADINGKGACGQVGHRAASTVGASGNGGSSYFGGGGKGKTNLATGAGIDGSGFGAGGGGALALNGAGPFSGGDGSPGVIIIWEFT